MADFDWYRIMQYGAVRPDPAPLLIRVPFEKFTEADILEMEKCGIPREEVENLNRLMEESNAR